MVVESLLEFLDKGEFPCREKDPKILGITFPYIGDLIVWYDLWL